MAGSAMCSVWCRERVTMPLVLSSIQSIHHYNLCLNSTFRTTSWLPLHLSFILIYLNLSLSSVAPSRRLRAFGAPELLAMSPRLASLLLWRASCHPGPALLTSIRRRRCHYFRPEVSRVRHVLVELPACHAGHGHGVSGSVRPTEPAPSSIMVQSKLPRVRGNA